MIVKIEGIEELLVQGIKPQSVNILINFETGDSTVTVESKNDDLKEPETLEIPEEMMDGEF